MNPPYKETTDANSLTQIINNQFGVHSIQSESNHPHYQNTILDKDTILLTFEVCNAKTEVQVLYIVPQDGSTPFFGFSPSLISRLHTPHNLQYSEDKPALLKRADEFHLIRKYRCVPVEASQVMASSSKDWSVTRVRGELLSFLEKYYLKTSLPFRFPRLVGMKAYLGVLLISFIAKLIYGLSSTPHAQNFKTLYGGDSEFHRHWQEVTNALPASHWYIESPLNPNHCHLDYPLITGYFHWFIGKYVTGYFVPAAILPSTVDKYGQPVLAFSNDALHRLRLQSSYFYRSYKYFFIQRITFVFFDTLFFGLSTIFLANYLWKQKNPRIQFCSTLIVLLTPLEIHVDHSNPQTNFLPLGFLLIAIRFALSSHFAFSACFAALSLLSKITVACIMPPFVVFVLSQLISRNDQFYLKLIFLMKLCVTVCVTFLVVNYPLLKQGTLSSILDKIFPFDRPLPDQVIPNLWNTINQIYTLKNIEPQSNLGQLLRWISQGLSIAGCVPALCALFRNPSRICFFMALQLCTLSFFQFNYCFHEKSLLFLIVPMNLTVFETPSISLLIANLICITSARYVIIESEIQIQLYFLILLCLILYSIYSKFLQKVTIQKQRTLLQDKVGVITLSYILICFVILEILDLLVQLQLIEFLKRRKLLVHILMIILHPPFILLWVDMMQRIFKEGHEESQRQTKCQEKQPT